jgi:hypothetical protein
MIFPHCMWLHFVTILNMEIFLYHGIVLYSITLKALRVEYKSWNSSLCKSLQTPVTSSFLFSSILLRILFWNAPNLCYIWGFHGDEDSSRCVFGRDTDFTLNKEAERYSETLVFFHICTRCQNPKDSVSNTSIFVLPLTWQTMFYTHNSS